MKADPIIAVRSVPESARWYESLLGCTASHGGDEFCVLRNPEGQVLLCLHRWGGPDQHPTMRDSSITPGNGLILYFRVSNLDQVLSNAESMGVALQEELHLNPNSRQEEISVRDPDGYYLTLSRYHDY